MLEVVKPAADRRLLSLADLKDILGETGLADSKLDGVARRVADVIAVRCNVARAGAAAPTLRQETLRQTIRKWGGPHLQLARRFVVLDEVRSDGALVDLDLIDQDFSTGMLEFANGAPCRADRLVVTYRAGFVDVPEDLKEAFGFAMREACSSLTRDPLLRSETVEGIGRFDYQVGGSGRDAGGALPPIVEALLATYRSIVLA